MASGGDRRHRRLGVAGATLLLALTPAAAAAHDGAHALPRGEETARASVQVTLADEILIDQDGRSQAFASETVGQRIVAITFIYTSCTTICPIMSAVFAAVQDQLDGELGEELRLISLSVDPVTDSPPRLLRYARSFAAGPGWSFLTGERPRVARVLSALGTSTANPAEHPPVVLVGDGVANRWYRLYGFPAAEEIVALLRQLAALRHGSHGH
jgi:protein SCO1